MKLNHILSFTLLSLLLSCGQASNKQNNTVSENKPGHFGKEINTADAISGSQLKAMVDEKDSVWVILESTIITNCQHSGCWMDIDLDGDQVIKVTFKDEEFTIPLDSKDKSVVVEGYAKKDFIPVDLLRHYAEDDGKSKEEIDAITEPQAAYTFEAIGVIIKE